MCKIHIIVAAAVCLLGCSSDKGSPPPPDFVPGAAPGATIANLDVTSPAFSANGAIPKTYTCEGAGTSPPLAWTGEPPGPTKSFAVIVEDPDAPDPSAPTQIFVHWVMYDLAGGIETLAEGQQSAGPVGGRDGTNGYGHASWDGPCPETGRHRYFFEVFALDAVLPDLGSPGKDQLLHAMDGHVLAKGTLIGTYQKGS